MIDRRLFIHFDWTLLGLVLILAAIGILNLYSITADWTVSGTPVYLKQAFWLLIGLVLMITVAFVEYRFYSDFAYIIYAVALFFLVVVLAYGIITSGAQRWIKIGFINFQPSELVKISFILALAKFFHRPPDREGYSLKHLAFPFLLLMFPMILILKQPDLGTAIILLLVFFSTLLFVKIRWSSLLAILIVGASILPLVWRFLKEYQKRRIITFFNPDLDPLGAGYHLIQSKIAVGSGGIMGKGFMHGTQCKLGFLPEQQTDFIFSVIGEEWGLIGSLLIMLALLFLDYVGAPDCNPGQRPFWCGPLLRGGGHALLAHLHQCRDGTGLNAGGGNSSSFAQLWRVLPRFYPDRNRAPSQCEYEEVSLLMRNSESSGLKP